MDFRLLIAISLAFISGQKIMIIISTSFPLLYIDLKVNSKSKSKNQCCCVLLSQITVSLDSSRNRGRVEESSWSQDRLPSRISNKSKSCSITPSFDSGRNGGKRNIQDKKFETGKVRSKWRSDTNPKTVCTKNSMNWLNMMWIYCSR